MLTQLTINNFAIVRHLDIEFAQKMSVITGETGAGKSIALDALGLCLGNRTELSMLRDKNQRTEVCASFNISENISALQWLKTYELQDTETPNECILRRIINSDGRSKAFINNTPVSAVQLKEIGQYLVHISGQHSSQLLLKTDYQLQLLDNFCAHPELLNQMQQDYKIWQTIQKKLNQFKQLKTENEARKQLLHYQVAELDDFNLQQGEFNTLAEEHRILSNSEQLTTLSQRVLHLLTDNDTANANSLIYRATKSLNELVELDSRYSDVQKMMEYALIQIQEASSEIQHLSCQIEQNPYALQEIENRLSQAIHLARKHNIEPAQLADHHQKLKQELNQLLTFSESESELQAELARSQACLQQSAQALTQSRQKGALKLAAQVTKSINKLSMENSTFFVKINTEIDKINVNGADNIIFTLQSNLGQQPQPLTKVASGGELSRIALAIQVITSHKSAVPTLIFDEIDVGISGATASVVGKLLRKLGEKCQVLCVTHLPQVASAANQHFWVEKSVIENKTETQMKLLNNQQRVKALARLLGGQKITETMLANAEELLALAS